MGSVSVTVLGDFELRADGEVVPVTRPLRALVSALAMRAGRVVSVDVLAAEVWQDQVPDRPRGGLHTLVNQLRKLVGAELVRTDHGGYQLDIPTDAVDALRFERLLNSVPGLQPLRARAVLDEALALWRSEVLDGLVPAHLVERYLAALEQRVDIDLEQGRSAELVPELQRLVAHHPVREPLWARLMTALFRSGRHAEALETYQTIRELLVDTFGTDPSPELRDLYLQVLAADDGLPAAGAVVPRQLPPDIAGFTGRTGDLAVLDKVFHEDGTGRPPVLMAVHGPGGAGKTTLALHWAHHVSDRFPGGQIYLDMRGYGPGEPVDPGTALDVVLRAVGVPAAQVPPAIEERTALWRTTMQGRQMLLLIDNVRAADQVRPLLFRAGQYGRGGAGHRRTAGRAGVCRRVAGDAHGHGGSAHHACLADRPRPGAGRTR